MPNKCIDTALLLNCSIHKVERLNRQRVEIDELQCGFMSGCGTTNAIFIVRHLQYKQLTAKKPVYMAFVNLEKKACL